MGTRVIVICDFCEAEMDESKKSGWISINSADAIVYQDAGKITLQFANNLFCTPDCLIAYVKKQVDAAQPEKSVVVVKTSKRPA
jgi:hypothetical protein